MPAALPSKGILAELLGKHKFLSAISRGRPPASMITRSPAFCMAIRERFAYDATSRSPGRLGIGARVLGTGTSARVHFRARLRIWFAFVTLTPVITPVALGSSILAPANSTASASSRSFSSALPSSSSLSELSSDCYWISMPKSIPSFTLSRPPSISAMSSMLPAAKSSVSVFRSLSIVQQEFPKSKTTRTPSPTPEKEKS